MALAGIYSTQLLYDQYIKTPYQSDDKEVEFSIFEDYRSTKDKAGIKRS